MGFRYKANEQHTPPTAEEKTEAERIAVEVLKTEMGEDVDVLPSEAVRRARTDETIKEMDRFLKEGKI